RPDKAQKIINRILNEQYSSKINGLPGNDDLGTMGAWYVFACIGMYPEIPGVGGFSINTPVFSSVKLHLKKGDIVINGGSEQNIYIKQMKLNGQPYNSTWLNWDDLETGALLEYTASNKPDLHWGTQDTPPSFP
ncbi:MAG: glycoside hydrolase family 92 protein, partial [Prevotella sp.]|nr:glycoside hydrolase family 92 protein [Prevotella sp.]